MSCDHDYDHYNNDYHYNNNYYDHNDYDRTHGTYYHYDHCTRTSLEKI